MITVYVFRRKGGGAVGLRPRWHGMGNEHFKEEKNMFMAVARKYQLLCITLVFTRFILLQRKMIYLQLTGI